MDQWDRRKEKKARFKRKLSRMKKRGGLVYGGYISVSDLFLSNEESYASFNGDRMKVMIEKEKEYPARECVECIFFKWIFGEDKKISGGRCNADRTIRPEEFEYGKRAKGCPLDECIAT